MKGITEKNANQIIPRLNKISQNLLRSLVAIQKEARKLQIDEHAEDMQALKEILDLDQEIGQHFASLNMLVNHLQSQLKSIKKQGITTHSLHRPTFLIPYEYHEDIYFVWTAGDKTIQQWAYKIRPDQTFPIQSLPQKVC